MARGPYLTDRIRELIAEIYDDDHQIKPTRARGLLLNRMKAEGLNETFGSDFPSVSSVSKELKKCRRSDLARSAHSKELDRPWSISRLTENPISYEALPFVLHIWYAGQAKEDPLTIRQAQWVDRLYPLAKAVAERVKDKAVAASVNIEELLAAFLQATSQLCAIRERVAELIGTEREPWPDFDLAMWEFVTGVQAPPDLVKRISPNEESVSITEKGLRLRITKEELATWQDVHQKLGSMEPLDLEEFGQYGIFIEVCEDMEAKSPKRKGGKK